MSYFNPISKWARELCALGDEQDEQQAVLLEAKQEAIARRSLLTLSDTGNAFQNFKVAFDQGYTPQELMLNCSYDQDGDSFRHPNSESGNYSATVRRDDQGVWRVNALSTSDPLWTAGAGAHDAFSVFTVLYHNGDIKAAMKDAGDNWLTIGGESYNKVVRREHQQKKDASVPKIDVTELLKPKVQGDPEKPKTPFSMKSFSLSGQSAIMKTQMLADRFVLDRIAILGQATTIYAKPNTGKTLLVLWMLIESIKTNRVNGEDVYYINADDDYKGLVFKTELAEQYGFHMLSPSHKGFESAALQGYMAQMITDNTARGTVIVLDTLKKFTDLMNKKTGSEFMTSAREYIANGGTLIMLAHCNKNRDADGKAVFGGTSDVSDDCDCVFMLDEVSKNQTTKQVLFENIKSRGVVASELAFSYSVEEGKHYQYRLDSVELADKSLTDQVKRDKAITDAREKDKEAIDAITEAIDQGLTLKTELITAAHDCSGVSKRNLTKVLNKYAGSNIGNNSIWREEVGVKNSKRYYLLSRVQVSKEDYLRYKDGE